MTDAIIRLNVALEGRYRVEREIGVGAMAVVYLAEDFKHERKVAIKVLKPELAAAVGAKRFLAEIKVTANLQHPNILPLYDSGEADRFLYYVMPYIEGATLRDKMDREKQLAVEEAVEIAKSVAGALNFAHAHNVIHRDIKPENILLQSGQALVADFGIALALSAVGGDRLTATGLSLGTPTYMSPEQAGGDTQLDGRSDLYSLACVLYEMLVGAPPFTGPTVQAVLARHMVDPVPPPDTVRPEIPSGVVRALGKALGKTPSDRFDSAAAFVEALTEETPERMAAIEAVAVLPFRSLSADPDDEFFADGITEEIINALAHLRGLRVAARSSSFAFKGKNEDLRVVARRLDVQAVVEGSVRKDGSRLRITVQLVNASDGYDLWSERYDRELTDVFAIQDEIATAIADRLQLALTGSPDGPLVKPSTANVDAYQLYLKGRILLYRRGLGIGEALECFKQAIELDPGFALAYAGLADATTMLEWYGWAPPGEAIPTAKRAAERSLELGPDLAEAHNALAIVLLVYGWEWEAADREFRRALELNPNYVQARIWHWHFNMQLVQGRFDEAVEETRRTVEIDPLSSYAAAAYALVLGIAGRFPEAIDEARRAVELDPTSYLCHHSLQLTCQWSSDYAGAIAAGETALALSGRHWWALAHLAPALAASGKPDEAEAIYDEFVARSRRQYVQPTMFAIACAAVGRIDEAFSLLDRAFEERNPWLAVNLKYWPDLDPLRGDPRFAALIERVGLVN